MDRHAAERLGIRGWLFLERWRKPAKWYKVVLRAGQLPRFPDLCCRCGLRPASSQEKVDICTEQGMQPGSGVGTSRLQVPLCAMCEGKRGMVVLAVLALFGWGVVRGFADPNRRFSLPALPLDEIGKVLPRLVPVAASLAIGAFVLHRYFRSQLEVFEQAEGMIYLFRVRNAAVAFAQDNIGSLLSASPDLLSPPAMPGS